MKKSDVYLFSPPLPKRNRDPPSKTTLHRDPPGQTRPPATTNHSARRRRPAVPAAHSPPRAKPRPMTTRSRKREGQTDSKTHPTHALVKMFRHLQPFGPILAIETGMVLVQNWCSVSSKGVPLQNTLTLGAWRMGLGFYRNIILVSSSPPLSSLEKMLFIFHQDQHRTNDEQTIKACSKC